jgi:hypothetical protein
MRTTLLLAIVSAIVLTPAPAWTAEPPQTKAPPDPTWLHAKGWPQFSFGFGATVGWGVAPRTAAGSALNMMWRWPVADRPIDGVSILYSLRWDPPAAENVGLGEKALTTQRMLILLDPCVHRWQLYVCVAIGGGRLGVEWEGWTQGGSYDYNPPIAVLGTRLGVDVPITRHFGIRVSGELLGLLNPAIVPIDDLHRWTTPRFSGGLELGIFVIPDAR